MAFSGGVLAQGQMASSEGSLYTPGGSVLARVNVRLHNTHSAAEDVQVLVKASGGTARLIEKATLEPGYSMLITDLHLKGGDDLRGLTTAASHVNFTVEGVSI